MFCERLKNARKKRRLSQEQVADILNTSRSNISKYETGFAEPNLQTLKELCELYETSADYLLGIKMKSQGNENNVSITQGDNGKATVNISNK